MCAQCLATGSMGAAAAATGARVWLAARAPAWLTPRRKRALSAVLVTCGVLAAGVLA
jgi:hypothetical protein